jgi:hypothetical protein
MSVKHLYLIVAAAILACAPAGGTSDPSGKPAPRRGNVLTAEEIAAAHADLNTAYDAIARLRPNWLAAHGAMSTNAAVSEYATVYVDGQKYGGISSLRNIPAYHIAGVRYYDVTESGAKFGVRGGTGGAIEVTTR